MSNAPFAEGSQDEYLTYAEAMDYTGLKRWEFKRVRDEKIIPTVREKRGQRPGMVAKRHCDEFLRSEINDADAARKHNTKPKRRNKPTSNDGAA